MEQFDWALYSKALMEADRKLLAIRACRFFTDLDLKEAKYACEALVKE